MRVIYVNRALVCRALERVCILSVRGEMGLKKVYNIRRRCDWETEEMERNEEDGFQASSMYNYNNTTLMVLARQA